MYLLRTRAVNLHVKFWLSWARLTMPGQARIGEDGTMGRTQFEKDK